MPPRANIVIGTPCYSGLVTHVYMHSLLKLMTYGSANNIVLGLWTAAHDSLVPRARNAIVAGFLDAPEATHLMFIDADTGFDPGEVDRLLTFNEEVVAGMYPVKNLDWSKVRERCRAQGEIPEDELRAAGLHYVGVPMPPREREARDGFVTARYAGTGFMMIRRSAIERMIGAYPETKYESTQTYPSPARQSDNLYCLFDGMIEPESRTYLSEDFAFCYRWRRLGGKVWLDTQSRLKHVGSCEYQGAPTVEWTKGNPG